MMDRGLSAAQMAGRKQNKSRMTVLFIINATGTDKRPLFFIGKVAKPRALHGRSWEFYGIGHVSNKKGWMTREIYSTMDVVSRLPNHQSPDDRSAS
jgi:hypothetical protein